MSFLNVLMMIILRIPNETRNDFFQIYDTFLKRPGSQPEALEDQNQTSSFIWQCLWQLLSLKQNLLKYWHTRQEEDNHHRVYDGEPVNLNIAHGEVRVPSRCPLHLTHLNRDETIVSFYNSDDKPWSYLHHLPHELQGVLTVHDQRLGGYNTAASIMLTSWIDSSS